MPLPNRGGAATTALRAGVERGKEFKAKFAKLESERDKRPMHERLSTYWHGRSVHKTTGDVTTWDNVKFEFKLDAASALALAEHHANEQAAASAGAKAVAAATASADGKSAAVVLPLAGRGTVSGGGTSCWHKYVIKFTLSGTFDLTTRTATVAKQHVDARFNNTVHYALKMEDLDGPARGFALTSADPNLVLRPIPPTPNADIPEADLCKVCLERAMNCILLPCAHIAICMSCSVALETCPICRKAIAEAKVFFKS